MPCRRRRKPADSVFFVKRSDQAEVAADSARWFVEKCRQQASPKDWFWRQALLHSGRQHQVSLNLSPILCSRAFAAAGAYLPYGSVPKYRSTSRVKHDREIGWHVKVVEDLTV